MDFQYSDEQTLLRDTTRDLLSRSYDAESRNKIIDTDLGWSRDVWSQLADTGILGSDSSRPRPARSRSCW
ncbi:acyl-CoA dehydrogenase domain protein [Mycobacterium ulcerans str. Harvey]|uniref:Acyl-CoA dehydrogenase domain protein n=1 Tax=Mycobacterium ulcerans str. Harvey TaxID=1299332 RepID=A0ABP3ACX0_MYCUL|nr:acyl-CoA dehydrogenase domain protein [Mycobacterium ulcerans str. Harvey]